MKKVAYLSNKALEKAIGRDTDVYTSVTCKFGPGSLDGIRTDWGQIYDVSQGGAPVYAFLSGGSLHLRSECTTVKLTDAGYLFCNAVNLANVSSLAMFDTSEMYNASWMFYNCRQLQDISALAGWDTRNLADARDMFEYCYNLQDISALAGWDTANLKNAQAMFYNCHSLRDALPLTGWSTKSLKDASYMFYGCTGLQDVSGLEKWGTEFNAEDMFTLCENLCIAYK